MNNRNNIISLFTPEIVLEAYSQGFFPMADSSDGKIYWHSPEPRAIIPFEFSKMPRSLKKTIEKEEFKFSVNADFEFVIRACASRDDTWINEDIIQTYCQIHQMGFAHSFETWKDGKIVGGLYGVCISKAFFGESMFNSISGASKAAFFSLVDFMRANKFKLLDTQFINSHTEMLGAVEIPRSMYLNLLNASLFG
jgi:leucyl/phenylalanyl-tRNA--protein transferase